VFDGQKLFRERAASQLAQVGQMTQERLTLLFEVWIVGGGFFYIVVIILQYPVQKQ
jgi:hypothetical protein